MKSTNTTTLTLLSVISYYIFRQEHVITYIISQQLLRYQAANVLYYRAVISLSGALLHYQEIIRLSVAFTHLRICPLRIPSCIDM